MIGRVYVENIFFISGKCMGKWKRLSDQVAWAEVNICKTISSAPNKDRMQRLCPREVDVSTNPIRARKPFGFSSSGVRVLDFPYFKKAFGASLYQ
jgi:hypothetical protein